MPDHSFWGLHDFCKHYNMYKKKHGRLNSMCAIETAIRAKRQLLLHQNAILSSIYVFFFFCPSRFGDRLISYATQSHLLKTCAKVMELHIRMHMRIQLLVSELDESESVHLPTRIEHIEKVYD